MTLRVVLYVISCCNHYFDEQKDRAPKYVIFWNSILEFPHCKIIIKKLYELTYSHVLFMCHDNISGAVKV